MSTIPRSGARHADDRIVRWHYSLRDELICQEVWQGGDRQSTLLAVTQYGYMHNPLGWVDPLGLACCPIKVSSRNEALKRAQEYAQVPRVSRGGQNITLEDLRVGSRGGNWTKMKAEDGKTLGRRNPTGKNEWFEHPDAGQLGIPDYHSGGHIHAIDPHGNEQVFTW